MLKILLNKPHKLYKKFANIRFRFDFPIKKNVVLFDESHYLILKEIIKRDFNILKVRNQKEIYFWIFIKQLILFDFKFITYCKNYLKFVSPKIVITLIDTNIDFYELKNSLNNMTFISIQNGLRTADWFNSKRMIKSKNLKCDHVFVFNKHILKKYKKHVNSNFHILGNFKNNIVKIDKSKKFKNFLFLSQFNKTDKELLNFKKKLFSYINLYLSKSNKKIYILLRNKNFYRQKEEMNFYKKILKSNCIFIKTLRWKQSYKILDKFENIIFMYSTLGYEAIARKKKIAIFSPKKVQGFKYYFGWPVSLRNKDNFFSAKHLTYSEIKRVLNNISSCTQSKWQNKYYSLVENQMYFNKNNIKLKKVIFKLL